MAEPTGEHVVRGGRTGGLNAYDYTVNGSFAGWDKCDDNAGEVGDSGENGDHFSAAMRRGNHGAAQPGDQT